MATIVRVPWFAVPQYAVVIYQNNVGTTSRYTVMDPREIKTCVVLLEWGTGRYAMNEVVPTDLVEVWVPGYHEALAILRAAFEVEIIDERSD